MRIITCMILVMHAGEVMAVKKCSKGTDILVKSCPKNKTMWTEASQRKNCTQFITNDCADLEYHCLINAFGNGTVEVCAKLTYLQGFCAEYNSLTVSIKDRQLLQCTNFTNGGCPRRYKSTDAYKYQRCYELVKRQNSNASRTSQHHQSQGSNGILIAVTIVMILILLSMCLFAGFMIYNVKCLGLSSKEAFGKLPLCGTRISKMEYFTRKIPWNEDEEVNKHNSESILGESEINEHEEEQSPAESEQTRLLPKEESDENNFEPTREQSGINDLEGKQRKMVLTEIAGFKDVFVTEKDKRISEEEISKLAPKLQALIERLDELRPLSEKILLNVKRFNSLLSPQKPKTISSKYIKKVTVFKHSLKKTEEEVQCEFQKLSKEVRLDKEFFTTDEEGTYDKRVDDLEKKITKLENMNN